MGLLRVAAGPASRASAPQLARVARRVGTPLCAQVVCCSNASPFRAPVGARLLCSTPNPEEVYERGLRRLDEGRLRKAVDDFAESASLGSAGGNFHLGLAYDGLVGRDARDEFPVEPDPAAAFRCYARAAEKGHSMAMLNLSMCYRNGEGVDADIGKAWKWLSLSAGAGCDRAQYNFAVALDPLHPPYGTPGVDMVAKSATDALSYYRKAVDQGHHKAMVNLGVMLYTGTGCDKDASTAETLWLEAHEAGVSQAGFCLRNMEKQPGKIEQMFE